MQDQIKQAVRKAVTDGAKAVFLDLNGVEFIDSQGLELLLWVRDYCQISLVAFRLVGLDQTCLKILEITRLSDEFNCSPDLACAIRSLA